MDYSPSDLLAAIDRRTRHTAALVPQVLEVMTHPGTTEGAGWDSFGAEQVLKHIHHATQNIATLHRTFRSLALFVLTLARLVHIQGRANELAILCDSALRERLLTGSRQGLDGVELFVPRVNLVGYGTSQALAALRQAEQRRVELDG